LIRLIEDCGNAREVSFGLSSAMARLSMAFASSGAEIFMVMFILVDSGSGCCY
jgi:hypothetical protein